VNPIGTHRRTIMLCRGANFYRQNAGHSSSYKGALLRLGKPGRSQIMPIRQCGTYPSSERVPHRKKILQRIPEKKLIHAGTFLALIDSRHSRLCGVGGTFEHLRAISAICERVRGHGAAEPYPGERGDMAELSSPVEAMCRANSRRRYNCLYREAEKASIQSSAPSATLRF